MLQRQQEGDGRRITNLVSLRRNISHNNPRVIRDFNGYKEKSCSYSKNSIEEGNSLWVVPSLRLKEIFTSSLTVTIQRNYSCSCRILLLPLKTALLFQNKPQRSKIWLGQGNQGGKDCYLTTEVKQGRKNREQRLTGHKITVWPDRRLNIAI